MQWCWQIPYKQRYRWYRANEKEKTENVWLKGKWQAYITVRKIPNAYGRTQRMKHVYYMWGRKKRRISPASFNEKIHLSFVDKNRMSVPALNTTIKKMMADIYKSYIRNDSISPSFVTDTFMEHFQSHLYPKIISE